MLTAEKIRSHRENLGYTQNDLAERSGLPLRTIQLLESGEKIAKGHNLRALRTSLGITPETAVPAGARSDVHIQLKLINLSALVFLVVPYGNLILPAILWNQQRKKDFRIDTTGRALINMQIIWSLVVSVLLIISPFIQAWLKPPFFLVIVVLILGIVANVIIILRGAYLIHQEKYDKIKSPIHVL